jgi:large subunit ribosomal protein L25
MQAQTLKAEPRTAMGTRTTRELRNNGKIPAIIYGHKETPVAISLDQHELRSELDHHHRVLTLNLSGNAESFLIKEVQYNHLGSEPLHLDLMRVDLNERVTVVVAIDLVGTPKGATTGGVLDQTITSVEVECTAADIPEKLTAVITQLDVDDTLTVGDLDLPSGVTVLAEPTTVVATLKVLAEEPEPGEGEEEGSAEPEVISKGKGEEEGDA